MLRRRAMTRSLALALLLALPRMATAADAGVVAGINGTPTVTRDGKTLPLAPGDDVIVGDRIETDDSAKLKVLLADDSVLAIGPNTQLMLDALTLGGERRGRLHVLAGRFKLAISAWLNGPSDYEIETPTAVAG